MSIDSEARLETGLVGRQREESAITALLERAAGGVGGILLLEGDAGIGKTALLEEARRQAQSCGGWAIRDAGADELEGERPVALVAAAFGELQARFTGVGPGVAGLALAGSTRLEIADIVVAIAEELRAEGPLLLAFDDLQWADRESLFALAALARRATVLGVAIVAAARPQPRSAALARLVDVSLAANGQHVVLAPLDDADARALAASVLEASPSADLARQLTGAGGNPWLIVELARHAAMALVGDGSSDALPANVAQAVARRMAHLPPDVANLLRIASVLGQRFGLEALEGLAGGSAGAVAMAMATAVDGGLLDDDGRHLRFRHDLVRQSLEASLTPSVCAALHREAAVVLRGLGAAPLEVAPHITRGALPGDEEAFRWLVEAAKDAEPTSASAAADLLAHAARLCTDPERRDDVEAVRARFLVWAGRPGDADALCAEIVSRVTDPVVLSDARAVQSRALFLLGRPVEAARMVDEGLGRDRPSAGTSEQLAGAELALATLFAGDHRRAADLAGAALAVDALEPAAASLARSVRGWCSALTGDLDGARDDVDAAVSQAHADPLGVAFRYHPHLFQAIVHNALTDTPGALLAIRTGRAIGVRLATGWDRAMYDWAEAMVVFQAGRWQDALALGEAGALAAEESGLVLGASWHGAIAAVVALRTGDLDGCERRLARMATESGASQLGIEWLAWANGLRAERLGELGAAGAVLGGTWRMAEAVGADSVLGLFGGDVFRVAATLGDRELAEDVGAQLARIAARPGGGAGRLHAGRATHVAALLAGRDAEQLAAACDLLHGGQRPYELAEALHDAALAWAVTGEKPRARAVGRDALDLYGEMGAEPDAARLRSALRAEGVALRQREGRSPATSGWESLTRSERRIVELVAHGLSNAQIADQLFVSRRTVESHLVHVYPKLSARSRVELALLVAEHVAVPIRPV